MIGSESPLRKLPGDLPPGQAMFYDGMRFAIEMLDVSYRRLVAGLEAIAAEEAAGSHVPIVMLDAWTIVDSANRLRDLLDQTPGLKKNTPPMRVVRDALAPCDPLRNFVQHLDGGINAHADSGVPTWGSLSWLRMDSDDNGRGFVVVPGAMRPLMNQGLLPSPNGLMFHENPDYVNLRAYGSA